GDGAREPHSDPGPEEAEGRHDPDDHRQPQPDPEGQRAGSDPAGRGRRGGPGDLLLMSDPRDRELHLLDYWRVLVKRRWVVYTSLAIVVSMTALGSLLTRPIYTATTRLQVEQTGAQGPPFQDIVGRVPD